MGKAMTLVSFVCAMLAITGVLSLSQDKKDAQGQPKQVTTASGLKYTDLVVGKGDAAKNGDKVDVHYTGWLYENGKRGDKFDSSVGRSPFSVTIGTTRVIQGWTEGLQGMRVGGKRELIIPPNLGYGGQGFPGAIPPNATLDFEIEMLNISK
jgi:FKBP-type peptidyl-prolyl cis-trans isomerase FkpA